MVGVKHITKSLNIPRLSRSWRLHDFSSSNSSLESCLSIREVPVPIIKNPSDILVRVRAASVNPLGRT